MISSALQGRVVLAGLHSPGRSGVSTLSSPCGGIGCRSYIQQALVTFTGEDVQGAEVKVINNF